MVKRAPVFVFIPAYLQRYRGFESSLIRSFFFTWTLEMFPVLIYYLSCTSLPFRCFPFSGSLGTCFSPRGGGDKVPCACSFLSISAPPCLSIQDAPPRGKLPRGTQTLKKGLTMQSSIIRPKRGHGEIGRHTRFRPWAFGLVGSSPTARIIFGERFLIRFGRARSPCTTRRRGGGVNGKKFFFCALS